MCGEGKCNSFRISRLASCVVLTLLMAGSWAGVAMADFEGMADRLPAETSSVIAVNVAKILESPYAKEQQWAETMAENWEKQPQMVPPGVVRLVMGADVMPSTMQSVWEVCLMQLKQMPEIDALVQAEGGHLDRVWDKDAAVSPRNAYFIPLDNSLLAAVTPGERRAIAKWLRQPAKPEGSVTSEYIQGALKSLGAQTDVLMAIDLEGSFSVPKIRLFLEDSGIEGLQEENLDAMAMTVGSLKGITLNITIDQGASGKAVIDFDRDATELNAIAKPLMIESMNAMGMHLDDLKDWSFLATGKQVSAEGKLSDASLKRLLGVVQSPVPSVIAASAAPAAPAASDPAAASQKYFKMVSANLDNLHEGASMSQSAVWLRGAATRIDHLPMLNVDPALLEWGALVSSRLKQAAATLSVNQTQASSRVAGVKNPDTEGQGTYDNYGSGNYNNGDYHWDHNYTSRAAYENARMERRKVGQEQRAKGNAEALKILNDMTGGRQKIRAEMTEKYGVEF